MNKRKANQKLSMRIGTSSPLVSARDLLPSGKLQRLIIGGSLTMKNIQALSARFVHWPKNAHHRHAMRSARLFVIWSLCSGSWIWMKPTTTRAFHSGLHLMGDFFALPSSIQSPSSHDLQVQPPLHSWISLPTLPTPGQLIPLISCNWTTQLPRPSWTKFPLDVDSRLPLFLYSFHLLTPSLRLLVNCPCI